MSWIWGVLVQHSWTIINNPLAAISASYLRLVSTLGISSRVNYLFIHHYIKSGPLCGRPNNTRKLLVVAAANR